MSNTRPPLVGLVMGSDSDWPIVQKAAEIFRDFDVPFEARVISAHRTPAAAGDYAAGAEARGLRVIVAAAGSAQTAMPDRRWRVRNRDAVSELDLRVEERWRQIMARLFEEGLQ